MYGQAKSLSAYTGSAANIRILIHDTSVISDDKNYIARADFGYSGNYPVTFTGGKATKSNNDADVKLTN
jgi:hypothetical protein